MTALGVVNPAGALLPATDRGTKTADMTEPGTVAPAIGLVVAVPAVPAGSATFATIGVVVPVAVKTTRNVCAWASTGTAMQVPTAPYATLVARGAGRASGSA